MANANRARPLGPALEIQYCEEAEAHFIQLSDDDV